MKISINPLNDPIIQVNDIFHELNQENKRLNNELLFANKCLDVLNRFKTYLYNNYVNKCKCNQNSINSNENQLKGLENDFNSIINEKQSQNKEKEMKKKAVNKTNKVFGETFRKKVSDMKLKTDRKRKLNANKVKKAVNTINKKRKPAKKKSNRSLLYRCDWIGCDFRTDGRVRLISHKYIHTGDRPFKCTVNGCDKSYRDKYRLKDHIHFVHTLEKSIPCELKDCDKKFKDKKRLRDHMKTHTDDKPFACDFADCEYRARILNCLERHKEAVHSNQRHYKCTVCDSAFKTYVCLSQHLKIHKNGPEMKCEFPDCDYVYTAVHRYRKHKYSVHNHAFLEKRFLCDWPGCQYKTNRSTCLKDHMTVHSEDRNYPCDWPFCDKKFKTRNHLREHIRIHLNDKRYKCVWPQCQYSCIQGSNLKKHYKVHSQST